MGTFLGSASIGTDIGSTQIGGGQMSYLGASLVVLQCTCLS